MYSNGFNVLKSLKMKPTVVSLFSGAGGMDEGFKAAGFEVLASMDIEEWACDTLRLNNPGQTIIGPPNYSGDIKEISPSKFTSIAKIRKGDVDVIIGGPPCQPFSQAASQRFVKGDDRFKRRGFNDEEKGTLLLNFIDYVLYFKPKVFVLENVPGLLTIDGGFQLKKSLKLLSDSGYVYTTPRTLNSVDYGVPQYRERLIIWGVRNGDVKPELPNPTHGNDMFSKPYNVVCQALIDIPEDCVNHTPRNHKPESVERYRTLDFGKREKLGRVDRLDPFKPSKTVIAGGMNGGGRSHLHPYLARTMTVRECARLQTFLDDFKFSGSIARQFTQVGNAVPPLLAEHVARKIIKDVFKKKVTKNFTHELHIQQGDIHKLSGKILEKVKIEKPEWIYHTHSGKRKSV